MTRSHRWFASLLMVVSVVVAGCGNSGGEAAVSIPDTPDGSVKAVAQSLANNQPRAMWDAMPAKWQSDVSGLVSDAAGKIDAEVYDKTFALVGKLSDVLAKQKKLVLQSFDDPQMAANLPVKKADVEAQYDTIVAFLGTVAKSDVSTVNGLKSLDIGKFLGTTGAKLMADMDRIAALSPDSAELRSQKASMANVKVETLESTPTSARVRVTSGDDVQEQELTKVDGKWVPRDMAEGWDEQIAEAKAQIAEMTDAFMAENKPQMMAMLNSLDAGLNTVAKAESKEELQQAVMGMFGAIMAQMMGGGF
jgi:hypothetical protein